jgi:hypothetical protein
LHLTFKLIPSCTVHFIWKKFAYIFFLVIIVKITSKLRFSFIQTSEEKENCEKDKEKREKNPE